ncbi:ThiF family protein [Calothrix parasitica NIES-267]|uniref:ThiF family protein n=1 Tax=Calothrix parasitica NIES-267 TaxID=1973488 RepID=A0A1Z4LTX5_9CYAN|nr:ThiF family protein [Calothrix parasitica NIES-267]
MLTNLPQSNKLQISKECLQDINKYIASHSPERGGALLGPVGKPIITDIIPDPQAQTTGASYLPSRQLTERVQQVEKRGQLEFKGVIHSHPGSLDRPSEPDKNAFDEGLKINPHMEYFVAPIVTMHHNPKRLKFWLGKNQSRDHELPLGNGKISFYVAYRSPQKGIILKTPMIEEISEEELTKILPEQPSVLNSASEIARMQLQKDLETICLSFGSNKDPEFFWTEIEAGIPILAGRVILKGDLELLFLINESYPDTPPNVLMTSPEGETEELQIPWSLEIDKSERLVTALREVIKGHPPYRKVYGPERKIALTTDKNRAGLAGWLGFISGSDPDNTAAKIQSGLFARSQGILSNHITSKRVLIVGTGSVGSYCAEQLTRSGVGAFTLIDPDIVEIANLCRTTYTINHLGRSKVEALAGQLLNINPLVEITLQKKSLSDFEAASLGALVEQADLVIATTDDPKAQRILNRFAYFHKKPALFVGLYKGASGGEVIFTVPERTSCYFCASKFRHTEENMAAASRDVDYGTGRLMSEVALATDIHHVTSVAVKMALSLLLPEDAQVKLKGFLNPQIDSAQNFLTLSMVPNYLFYPQVFGDTPGQYAYQSVWLKPQRHEECPVCGNIHNRVDPYTIPLQKPALSNIARLTDKGQP